ncbi:MAG: hypothetical protein DHS20C01_16870 [marine bacterium B5-7]|nr:MAG: hypothetical protein DHS20C01_16870 [marine bacterium B5-7]
MEPGQNDLDSGDIFAFVTIHRHTAAIVADRHRTVCVENNIDAVAEAGQGFVNAIIDDLLGKVIRTLSLSEHTGTFPHRFKAR